MSATRPYHYQVRAQSSPPPSGQLGSVNTPGVLPWSEFAWIDQTEHVPELTWPSSVKTYHQMRTDSQCYGLYLGCTMPIRRYEWMVAHNGAKEEIVARFAEDINLPIQGENQKNRPRIRDKFNWGDFLRQALLATVYGHYYFEIVGQVQSDGLWHLQGLAPRPPATIQQVNVDNQGGLVWVKQAVGSQAPQIPANRLIPFVWDREGGNWFGRSMFRSIYKNWLIKDRLLRVDAMKHDRNGLGVPWIEAPPGASKAQIDYLNHLAQAFRAGDMSGAATPSGAKLQLVGTSGGIPDTVGSIKMHDEAMARAFLMMFLQLGQTTSGSRALGESFVDYFALAQQTIAYWIEDIMSSWLIEDWVDWNFGEEDLVPLIVHERDPDPELSVTDLAQLVDKNIIHVDDELESYIRDRYLLPKFDPNAESTPEQNKPEPPAPIIQNVPPQPPVPAETPPSTETSHAHDGSRDGARRRATVSAVSSLLPLPDRTLRRQPYEQEVKAAVDFKAMDASFTSAKTKLVSSVKQNQSKQISQIQTSIKSAGSNLEDLSNVSVDAIHSDTIQSHMVDMMNEGAKHAISEALSQGKHIEMPDMSATVARLSSRAKAVDQLLSRSLAEAGARRAVAISGPAKTAEQVAADVGSYLSGLSTSYLEDQLGGALQQAYNSGRKEVMSDGDANEVYASELLDSNTCSACTEIDGTQYDTIDDAEDDYPTGGYIDCEGGPRCRGTLIAVYGEVEEEGT